MHDCGLVYNDLKLDNLMFDFDTFENRKLSINDDDLFEKTHINIVDFGFATPYLNDGDQ